MSRILVVDDDKLYLASLCRQLRRRGYFVLQARNGPEAITLLERVPVDLVVTDILMPEGDGLTLIREVRRRWPALHVIAVSGGGVCEAGMYLDLSLKLGASRAFEKPYPMEGLLSAVQDQMKHAEVMVRHSQN